MPASKIARPKTAAASKNGHRPVKAKKVARKKASPEKPREYTAEELWDEEEIRFLQPYVDRLAAAWKPDEQKRVD